MIKIFGFILGFVIGECGLLFKIIIVIWLIGLIDVSVLVYLVCLYVCGLVNILNVGVIEVLLLMCYFRLKVVFFGEWWVNCVIVLLLNSFMLL